MKTIILSLALSLMLMPLAAQTQEGTASYYADKFEGRKTASGEKYSATAFTAAHRFLPFGTIVRVTNLENNKSADVRINDRGPFVEGRIIDLSWAAAEQLNFITQGLAKVKLEVIDHGQVLQKSNITGSGYSESIFPESDFYRLKSDYVYPTGFGVQLASFSEPANLVGMSASLKNSYKKQVHIQVKRINGQNIYAVILGDYKNRKQAEKLLAQAKEQFPGAFIVNYSNLK